MFRPAFGFDTCRVTGRQSMVKTTTQQENVHHELEIDSQWWWRFIAIAKIIQSLAAMFATNFHEFLF